MIINPTLACANQLNLKADIDRLIASGAQLFHIDIMDGHYVPNLCFSFDTVEQIRKAYPELQLDIHIMTDKPLEFVNRLIDVRPKYLVFHPMGCSEPERIIDYIRSVGMAAGIAIEPGETAEKYLRLYCLCDQLLVMAVKPGFSGQRFMESTYATISSLDALRNTEGFNYIIQVDGGISSENVFRCAYCGADVAVAGALAIFGQSEDLGHCFSQMSEQVKFCTKKKTFSMERQI